MTQDGMLEDFLVFLGKTGRIEAYTLPSGAMAFGPNIGSPEEIIAEYWETFQ